MKYSTELKSQLITRFLDGESISTISAEADIPKSTLYSWVQLHIQIKSHLDRPPTIHQYNTLKSHAEKLESMIEVLQMFIFGVDTLNALHLKYHIYIEGPEHPHIFNGIQGVSRKAMYRFCEDDVDLPGLAHLDHTVEFIPLFCAGACDALVCEYFHRLPIGVAVDLVGVLLQLVFIAVELLIRICADPAIGGHPVFTGEALCGLSLFRRYQGHILCQLAHFRSPFLS